MSNHRTQQKNLKDRVKEREEEIRLKQINLIHERISRYNNLFRSEDGLWVLNDLKDNFGWDNPTWDIGMSPTDIAGLSARRCVLEHIQQQLDLGTQTK